MPSDYPPVTSPPWAGGAVGSSAGSLASKTNSSNLKAGPINPQNGFPFWYEDHGLKNENGDLVRDPVRLDLCLNPVAAPAEGGGYCATPFEMPADWLPEDGVAFPERFPGEAFWFAAESGMETSEDGEADLILATEAAFLNEEPKASDRMVFGRVRIRIDDLVVGEKYTVTHPYGQETFVAEDDGKGGGEINTTEDIGCMMPSEAEPCDFGQAGFGSVGPYLTLANGNEPTAPDGGRYLSDPVGDEDVVTGSPYGTNFFRVEGPGLQGSPDNPVRMTAEGTPYLQTDFFSLVGKRSEFQAAASKVSGSYNTPSLSVTLGASESDAEIFYTTDPNLTTFEAIVDGGTRYEQGITVDLTAGGSTELRYVALVRNPDGSIKQQTPVYDETYTLDQTAPDAPVDLALDAASNGGEKTDTLTNDTTPTFVGTAEAGSTVRIFDGNRQVGSGRAAAATSANPGAFSITASVLSAGDHTITATVTDTAGNTATSAPLTIRIDDQAPTAPTANPAGGTYTGTQSVGLSADEAQAKIYYATGATIPKQSVDGLYDTPIAVSSSQTINTIAVDAAGNESVLASFDYVIRPAAAPTPPPNTLPTITALSPAPGSTTRDQTPTIRATVGDAQTDLRKADITLVVDGRPVTNFTYDRRRDRLTFTPRARLELNRWHTVRIVATDEQGERTPKSWRFRIERP